MESCDCSGDATRYDCDSESTTTTTRHAGPRQRSRARTAFAPGFSRWFLRRLCSLSGMRAICMNKVGTMGRKGGRKEQGRMVPALNFPARERGYKIERRQSLPPSLRRRRHLHRFSSPDRLSQSAHFPSLLRSRALPLLQSSEQPKS